MAIKYGQVLEIEKIAKIFLHKKLSARAESFLCNYFILVLRLLIALG